MMGTNALCCLYHWRKPLCTFAHMTGSSACLSHEHGPLHLKDFGYLLHRQPFSMSGRKQERESARDPGGAGVMLARRVLTEVKHKTTLRI